MTTTPGAMNEDLAYLDPIKAQLSTGVLAGTIHLHDWTYVTGPDGVTRGYSATVELDDGTAHEIEYHDSPTVPLADGDRVEFRMVAEDGWIASYDVVPEGWEPPA